MMTWAKKSLNVRIPLKTGLHFNKYRQLGLADVSVQIERADLNANRKKMCKTGSFRSMINFVSLPREWVINSV